MDGVDVKGSDYAIVSPIVGAIWGTFPRFWGLIEAGFQTCSQDEQDFAQRRTETLFEWMYFLLHLASRSAAATLTEPKRGRVLNAVGTIVGLCCVNTCCENAPNVVKEAARSAFYDNLNRAELEYARCEAFFIPEKPFTGNSMFTRFAQKVAGVLGRADNPVDFEIVISAAMVASTGLDFDGLVKKAGELVTE